MMASTYFKSLIIIHLAFYNAFCEEIHLKCDKASNEDIINRYQKYCAKDSTTCIYRNINIVDDQNDVLKHPHESKHFECVVFSSSIITKAKTELFNHYHSVKFIDASYSGIEILQDFTFKQKSLVELNLRGNKIRSLSGLVFSGAENLKTIDLSHNEISFVNVHTFTNMKSLVELDLSNNLISSVNAFMTSGSLKVLNLSFNKLDHLTLPFDSFSRMPKLEVLNLRNNSIGVDFGNFASNSVLRTLDLSYCGLTYFDLTVLLSVQTIEELYVHGNNLKYSGQLEFERSSFPFLHTIGLSDNQFACEVLATVVKRMDRNKIKISVEDGNFVINTRNIRGIQCI